MSGGMSEFASLYCSQSVLAIAIAPALGSGRQGREGVDGGLGGGGDGAVGGGGADGGHGGEGGGFGGGAVWKGGALYQNTLSLLSQSSLHSTICCFHFYFFYEPYINCVKAISK